MTTYYLSAFGNDTDAGTSASTPWKTITKLATVTLKAGDHVRFRRGDTFYGVFGGALSKEAFDLGSKRVTFSPYGAGNRPVISAAKIIKSTSWESVGSNVWRVAINDNTKIDGYNSLVGVSGANIGFLRTDDVIRGVKKFLQGDLAAQWDFYSDEAAYLYVYSTANPSTLASSIIAAPNGSFVRDLSGTRWAGLEFRDIGGHGVSSTMNDVDVIGCVFSGIGGSRLVGYSNPTTRYGNGAEAWRNSARINVSSNWFIDVYDVGCTMQGTPVDTSASGWDDITYRHNRFVRCNQVFETWCTYDSAASQNPTPAGSGFRRCVFEYNEAWDTGYGWSGTVRPDQTTRAPILMYHMHASVNDIKVCKNRFHGFKGPLIYRPVGVLGMPSGFVFEDNVVIFDNDVQRIHSNYSYTASQWSAFTAATGIGAGCSTHLTPSSNNLDAILRNSFAFSASGISADASNFDAAAEAAALAVIASADADGATSAYTPIETLGTATVDATQWAPLLDVTISNAFQRFDGCFAYATGGDSGPNRGGVGFLNLQFVPNAGLTGLDYCGVDNLPLMFSSGLPTSMFAAVVVTADGTQVKVRLLVNVGLDNYMRMAFTPVNILSTNSFVKYTLLGQSALITLPAGTATYSGTINAAGAFRPAISTAAPSITPTRAGDRHLDTTSKRSWQAFGTGSSTDWIPDHPLSGTSAPTSTPQRAGQEFVDTTAKRSYRSFGTTGSSDWFADQPLTGSGAPSSTPKRIGDSYADTTNKVAYRAYGTSSSNDWVMEGAFNPILAFETTLSNTVDTTLWAPILTVTITNTSARFDAMLAYVTGGDSAPNRGGMGFLNLQFVPNAGLTGLALCSVDLAQLIPFVGTAGYLTEDSFAAVSSGDGTTLTVQLLVNIGRDSYLMMRVTPIDIIRNMPSVSAYTFFNKAALVTLPAGTVNYSSTARSSSGIITGTAAPSTTPVRVGAVYLDTTNKKEYRAFGTASAADWVILN